MLNRPTFGGHITSGAFFISTDLYIFAAAMLRTRRIFAAWLLSVILPVVFLAPFHHHHRDALEDIHCEACSQHIPHQGHLTPGTGTDDCLIPVLVP